MLGHYIGPAPKNSEIGVTLLRVTPIGEKLARYGHHPDAVIDAQVEQDRLKGLLYDARAAETAAKLERSRQLLYKQFPHIRKFCVAIVGLLFVGSLFAHSQNSTDARLDLSCVVMDATTAQAESIQSGDLQYPNTSAPEITTQQTETADARTITTTVVRK